MDQKPQRQSMGRPVSKYFTYQKWTLFAIALFGLLASMLILLASAFITYYFIEMDEKNSAKELNDDEKKEMRLVIMVVVIAATSIGSLLHLIGMLGAYKEHYCLSMTYSVFFAIATVILAIRAVMSLLKMNRISAMNWIGVIIEFAIFLLAYSFAMNILISSSLEEDQSDQVV